MGLLNFLVLYEVKIFDEIMPEFWLSFELISRRGLISNWISKLASVTHALTITFQKIYLE